MKTLRAIDLSTVTDSIAPMYVSRIATSLLSSITPHNPENDKPGASGPLPAARISFIKPVPDQTVAHSKVVLTFKNTVAILPEAMSLLAI